MRARTASTTPVHQPAANPPLRGSLANALIADAMRQAEDPNPFAAELRDLAAGIRRGGRWELDFAVIEQADRLRADADAVLADFHRLVRLPLDPLWLEWRFPEKRHPGQPERAGVLAASHPESGLMLRFARHSNGRTSSTPYSVRAGHAGCELDVYGRLGCEGAYLSDLPWIPEFVWDSVCLLMVLTAHRAPVAVGDEPDYTRLNKARARKGKAPLYGLRPVRWDLTRVVRAAAPEGEGRGPMSLHLQRGHYKVRETGVFWWRPHLRGRGGGALPEGRDHCVSNRLRPAAQLGL